MEVWLVTYPFTYKLQVNGLEHGVVAMPGQLFNGDMDDLIEELNSVEVDGEYLIIRGTKQKHSPKIVVSDGSQDMITDPPTS